MPAFSREQPFDVKPVSNYNGVVKTVIGIIIPDPDSIQDIIKHKASTQEVPNLIRMRVSYTLIPFCSPLDTRQLLNDLLILKYNISIKSVDWSGNEYVIASINGVGRSRDQYRGIIYGVESGSVDVTSHYRLMPIGIMPVSINAFIRCEVMGEPIEGLVSITGRIKIEGSWGW